MEQLSLEELRTLLRYLIDQIQERGGTPIKTQLVKLLYLVDLEYYRAHKKTLTGLPWLFYHYGPYAFELETIVSSLSISDVGEKTFLTARGKHGISYGSDLSSRDDAERDFIQSYKQSARSVVDRVIDQWALEDLWILLDYVYYETEPMKDVKRGEALDFTKVMDVPRYLPQKAAHIDSVTLNGFRKRLLENRKEKTEPSKPTPPPYDEIYDKAMLIMDNQEKKSLSS